MAIFDRLDRMTSTRVDRMFAVGATIDGMTSTANGRPQVDPARAEIIVKGILDETPAYDAVEVGNRNRTNNDLRTLVTGTRHAFSIDVRRYPRAAEVRQGDRVSLDDGRVFEVLAVQPDGQARSVFVLTKGSRGS